MADKKKRTKRVVKVKKQPKVREPNIVSDSLRDMAEETWQENFLPKTKEAVNTAFSAGIDSLGDLIKDIFIASILGDGTIYTPRRTSRDYTDRNRPRRDYAAHSKMKTTRKRGSTPGSAESNAISSIVFDSYEEADVVLDMIGDAITTYGYATRADFYDAAGYATDHVDDNWGWHHVGGAQITRDRNGTFRIRMPRIKDLTLD